MALSLFNLLQFPLAVLPSVISALVSTSVTFDRLHKFLTSEELDKDSVSYEPVSPKQNDASSKVQRLEIRDGSFTWSKSGLDAEMSSLKDISLSVDDGQLVAIVGGVGCGKSSLISCLLGEMYKTGGSVSVRGSLSYVAQSAWIINATVKDNILFGRRYDKKFYEQVIEACALRADLDNLPGGDETEIGEKGINLSGGQKQVGAFLFVFNCFSASPLPALCIPVPIFIYLVGGFRLNSPFRRSSLGC